MYCTHCGEEIEDGATFCTHCGAHLTDEDQPDVQPVYASQTTPVNEQNSESEKPTNGKAKWVIIALSVAIVVVVAVILILTFGSETNKKTDASPSAGDSTVSAEPSSNEDNSDTSTTESKNDDVSSSAASTVTAPSTTTSGTSTTQVDNTSANQALPSSNPYAAYTSDYVIADSSTRTLSASSLAQYNAEQLKLARNEIFARKGRIFKDADLDAYFRSKQWYSPSIEPDVFDANTSNYLSEVERDNAGTIIEYEKANGMPT